jgi:protein O-mannosyl-transferase
MTKINNRRKEFIIKHRNILVCLFLVMATLAVYWQVQNFHFVNFDDGKYIYENHHVQEGLTLKSITWAFTTFHASNWHPLTWLSHMLDYQFYGMNPGWHHLTNLFFHIANTLLLFFVFRKMTGSLWQSAFIAALFALHPLHVESVVWVSERKDVLSTFFWMLTMWSYIWYVENPVAYRYVLVFLFFAIGLMSKPMLVTLPFVLLLLDYYPLNRFKFQPSDGSANSQQRSNTLRLTLEKTPLFALAAMSSAITFYAQKKGGAVTSLEMYPFKVRIANALVSYVTYIGKMIYPSKLAVLYPHPGMLPWWEIAGACFLLVSISLLAIRVVKQSPYFAVGWLWYLGTLVPVIGLVQVGSQSMADRYTYVPLIGLFIIVACGVPELVKQWRYRKIGLTTLATVFLTILMAMTWKQVGYWENGITLFEHALKVTSNNHVAHNNLGLALDKQGHTAEAIEHYLQALRIKPDLEEAHNNLGLALDKQGHTAEAIEHYLQALRIKPDYAKAHNNLGLALDKQGHTAEAIEHYSQALRIKPDFAEAHYNLGLALDKQGHTAEAIEHYLQALRIKPDFAEAHYNLGLALKDEGRTDEAIDHYLQALRIKPDYAEAHYNMGNVLYMQKRIDEAIDHYLLALRIKPDYTETHNNLGLALKDEGRTDEAIDHYLQALRIKPDYEKAQYNLNEVLASSREIDRNIDKIGNALKYKPNDPFLNYILGNLYKINGKSDKAIEYYQKALSFKPDFIEAMYDLAKLFIIKMEYEKALSLYQKMIGILPDHAAVYYNIACIYARQNKPEKSISWLKKAVENGFDDWNHIKTDIDLKNIRGSSCYKEFIKGH